MSNYKEKLQQECAAAMNRIAKWRTIFVGWQLGTRVKGDPEADAVRDMREALILLRVEMTALTRSLIDTRIISLQTFQKNLIEESKELEKMYQRKFPGFSSTDDGMHVDVEVAKETTKTWPK